MPFSYQYDLENNIIHTTAMGFIALSDIENHFFEVVENPQIKKEFIDIVDLEKVKNIDISFQELAPLQEIWNKFEKKGLKTIMVNAPTDISFGTFRMIKSFLEMKRGGDDFILVRSKRELETKIKQVKP